MKSYITALKLLSVPNWAIVHFITREYNFHFYEEEFIFQILHNTYFKPIHLMDMTDIFDWIASKPNI